MSGAFRQNEGPPRGKDRSSPPPYFFSQKGQNLRKFLPTDPQGQGQHRQQNGDHRAPPRANLLHFSLHSFKMTDSTLLKVELPRMDSNHERGVSVVFFMYFLGFLCSFLTLFANVRCFLLSLATQSYIDCFVWPRCTNERIPLFGGSSGRMKPVASFRSPLV